MKKKTFILILILATFAMLAGACGNNSHSANQANSSVQPSSSPLPSASTAQEEAPVEIDNLGKKLTFSEAPKRPITLNQHATEIMLALDLESVMVGTAYLDDEILPELKEKYDAIPVLSEQYPSKEVFLAATPDFAYAGWKSAFEEKALGSRSELEQQGILTYVQESSNISSPTLEDVYQDILNIGEIFRIEPRAQALVDSMDAQLKEIQAKIGQVDNPLKIFVYDSGEDKAFTAANTYLTDLINKVDAKNIFDDIDKGYTEVSWEEVVNRNPDVIVIIDYGDTTAEQKKQLLLSQAALANIKAIQDERFIIMPLSAAAEGIRAPIALKTLAEGLYPDKFND
ncbi:ABC transporter substrate-binding protein [Paenibacillus sp. FSL L8-0709]|uniref:ABC transporter substrate-binding protein n=1 Tax=Paenibacillus sp. FSL L8-0709 TaxID=2975312 RepID=UPI0030F4FCA6